MPILVTAEEVSGYAELTRRVGRAASTVGGLATEIDNLLRGTAWFGIGADAARGEAQRLARSLRATGAHLEVLSAKTNQTVHALAEELARQRIFERGVLHELGRLAAVPGDLEARTRAALGHLPHQLRDYLPMTFRVITL